MKKGSISILLIIIMFVVVGFALSLGWFTIKDQNISFNNIQRNQTIIAKEVNFLRDSLTRLNWKLSSTTSALKNLKMAIDTGEMTSRKISSRISDINDKIVKWQVISDEMISKVEELSTKIQLSKKPIKEIELGKVSVEKGIAQSTQEESSK